MNWPYLILGLLSGLGIGYALGWQSGQRVRRLRAAMDKQMTPDCFGGIRCSECPGTHMCGTGCFYQSDYYKSRFKR